MRITIFLKASLYDCKIKITDSMGIRDYYITAPNDDNTTYSSVIAEVFDNEFTLSLIPLTTDTDSIIQEYEEKSFKDRFAKKATKVLFKTIDKTMLRIGCDYRVTDLNDGDRLDIELQHYSFGDSDINDTFDLMPMEYMFFEVSNFNKRFEIINAYGINGNDVLRFAKLYSFSNVSDDGIAFLFTYPFHIIRIKQILKDKRIFKTIAKFNSLDDTERQKLCDKQNNLI